MPIPPRLLRAYRQTGYRAGGITVRIDRHVPDILFAMAGARAAVIVTAWNPMSRRMPDGWNRRMQQRLRQCLYRFVVIEAEGSLRRWHEAMLLVGGDPQRIARIAARFRQHAVVVVRRGQAARLRLVCGSAR